MKLDTPEDLLITRWRGFPLPFSPLPGYLHAMSEAEAGLAVVPGIRLTDRIGIGVLTRLIDRDLVDDVLAETGRAEQRSRLLSARVVVYYVLGLCLFFGDAYEEVMRLLVAACISPGHGRRTGRSPLRGPSRRRVSDWEQHHCSCCSNGSQFPARNGAPGAAGLVPAG
jgi:hypothetical protein